MMFHPLLVLCCSMRSLSKKMYLLFFNAVCIILYLSSSRPESLNNWWEVYCSICLDMRYRQKGINNSKIGNCMLYLQIRYEVPATTPMASSANILQELCPSVSVTEIEEALLASGGDVNDAAQNLLGGN